MSVATTYTTISGDPTLIAFPHGANLAGRHWSILVHGHNAAPTVFAPASGTFGDDTTLLVQAGQVVFAPDAGGDAGWSGPAVMDILDAVYAYATGTLGLDPVCGAGGSSMGGLTVLNWARRNQSKVDRIAVWAPVTDPDWVYANIPAWSPEMDAAFGGDYAANGAGYSPIDDADDFDWCPLRIWHGDADTTIPYTQSVAFAAAQPNVDLTIVSGALHGLGPFVPATATCAALASPRLSQGVQTFPITLS